MQERDICTEGTVTSKPESRMYLAPRKGPQCPEAISHMSTVITVKIQKHFTDQIMLGRAALTRGRRLSGWSEGLKMRSRRRRKGKVRVNKREKFLLFGCCVTTQGNTAQPESLKPWLGKAMEGVQETKLEFGLVWWDQKAY